MQQTSPKGGQVHIWMSGKGDPLGIVQEVKICQCNQMIYTNLEYETHKILWYFEMQMDQLISARRSDMVLIKKKKRICYLEDFAIPADHRVKR